MLPLLIALMWLATAEQVWLSEIPLLRSVNQLESMFCVAIQMLLSLIVRLWWLSVVQGQQGFALLYLPVDLALLGLTGRFELWSGLQALSDFHQ